MKKGFINILFFKVSIAMRIIILSAKFVFKVR